MSDKQLHTICVRILGLLKTSKLEYLKTADGQHPTDTQRFLHKQARLRHHFFQDLELQLRSFFKENETFHLAGIQMEQRLVASLQDSQKTSLENCLEIDSEIQNLLNEIAEEPLDLDELSKTLSETIISLEKLTQPMPTKTQTWI